MIQMFVVITVSASVGCPLIYDVLLLQVNLLEG